MLYRWRREFSAKLNGSFPGSGKVILIVTKQELARLRKELRDIQLEHDILKAAVIVFEYIKIWYNQKSKHSDLGYVSPKEFEEISNKQKIAS
jgi:transposase-like protein